MNVDTANANEEEVEITGSHAEIFDKLLAADVHAELVDKLQAAMGGDQLTDQTVKCIRRPIRCDDDSPGYLVMCVITHPDGTSEWREERYCRGGSGPIKDK